MQRTLFFFIFCLFMGYTAISFSQDSTAAQNTPGISQRHNLAFGFGTLTPDYLMDGYRPGRPTEFDYTNKGASWVTALSYKYQFSKKTSFGLTGTIEQQYGDWLDNEIPGGNVFDLQTTVKGEFVRTCVTIAPELRTDYMSNSIFRIYTVLGFGVTYEFETDQYNPDYYNQGYRNGVNEYGQMRGNNNKAHINGYYAPIGIEAGKKLNFFTEFGFGYKGVINGGLSYRF